MFLIHAIRLEANSVCLQRCGRPVYLADGLARAPLQLHNALLFMTKLQPQHSYNADCLPVQYRSAFPGRAVTDDLPSPSNKTNNRPTESRL